MMLRALRNRIKETERYVARTIGTDITTPRGRRGAWLHFYLVDHGFLRGLWTNQFEIAPGVWRSNQPSPARLRKLRKQGIRTILNLRGTDHFSFYLFEKEACAELGIELIDYKFYARHLVPRDHLMRVFDLFDQLEAPFLLHCKSGADRAGLVSALWLLDKEGADIATAKEMLSLKYVHLRGTRTGIMDHVLEAYEADTRDHPMPIRQWVAQRYDNEALMADFKRQRGSKSR